MAEAETTLLAVKALHYSAKRINQWGNYEFGCAQDWQPWPCETMRVIQALETPVRAALGGEHG